MAQPRRSVPAAPRPAGEASPPAPPAAARLPPAGPHEAAARELVGAGLLAAASEAPAAEVIRKFATSPRSYSFSADAEYLHHSVSHHMGAYFRQVLEPLARAHHSRGMLGRMLKDEDVDRAATEISVLVAGELGAGYSEYMGKYFEGREGLVTYIYSRVRNLLMEEAMKHNDAFLGSLRRRERTEQVLAATTGKAT